MGIIVRTNGMGRSAPELQTDLDQLADTWGRITGAAAELPAPFPLYKENNVVLRALRDYLRPDIGEVIVDNAEIYEEAKAQMLRSMPAEQNKLKLYRDDIPLFSRYQVESQIESAHERMVRLPSGGSIVIDHTEALTAIDINSAKATGGGGIEETALQTNLEAAEEIARQLRLRDLGGLIVIDFIDMNSSKNQRDVEKAMQQACDIDRARVQVGRLSRFGLLEMSRQRLRPSLSEHTQIACPRCEGRGQIRSVESLALAALRLIEEECMKDRTGRVIAQLPVDVATYLLNEKRGVIAELESRYMVVVTLVPNETLETPKYEITRIRADHLTLENNSGMSYRLPQDYKADARAALVGSGTPQGPRGAGGEAAVKLVLPDAPAPLPLDAPDPTVVPVAVKQAPAPVAVMRPVASGGFWAWLKGLFGGGKKPAAKQSDSSSNSQKQRNGGQPQGQGQQQRRDGNRGDGRRDGGRPQDGQQRRDGRDGANRSDGRNEGRGEGRGDNANRNQRPPQDGQQRRDGRGNSEGRDRSNEPRNAGGDNRPNRGERGAQGSQQPRQPQQQNQQPRPQNPRNQQQPQANAVPAVAALADGETLTPVVAAAAAAAFVTTASADAGAPTETMSELMAGTTAEGEAIVAAEGQAGGEGREGGGRRGRRGRRGRGRGRNGENAGERNPNAAPGSEGEGNDEGGDGDEGEGNAIGLNLADDTSPMFDPGALEPRAGSDEPGYAPRRDQRPQRVEVVAVAEEAVVTPVATAVLIAEVVEAPIASELPVETPAAVATVEVIEVLAAPAAEPVMVAEAAVEPAIAAVETVLATPVEVAVVAEPVAEAVADPAPVVEFVVEAAPAVVFEAPAAAQPAVEFDVSAEALPVAVEATSVAAEGAPAAAVLAEAPAPVVEMFATAAAQVESEERSDVVTEKKPDATA